SNSDHGVTNFVPPSVDRGASEGPPGPVVHGSVVELGLNPDRVAAIVADGERDHHRARCAGEIRALALGLELEAVASPGLDLHFQPRDSHVPFELERAVPVAPERPGWNRRGEGPDLESHDLGVRMNPVAPRAEGERAFHLELALVPLVLDLNPGVEGGERHGARYTRSPGIGYLAV